jgi:16S rRNA (guanine1516-N2)-methyltransferase
MNAPTICIVCTDPARKEQVDEIARLTGLPLLNEKSDGFDLQLRFDDDHLSLFDRALNTSIHVDFAEGALAHRQQFGGGRGQAIAKAVGLKHGNTPNVLDITAGLARDAYILACLGCKITLVEQSAVLYVLVEDGIQRGLASSTSDKVLKNFIDLVNADSVAYMQQIDREHRPDVIYIDPMYPERKKSALVKKDMQILQRLLGKDEDAEQLLKTALKCAGKRVVVKRPIHANAVGNIKPETSISSKKTRYDVYLVKNE